MTWKEISNEIRKEIGDILDRAKKLSYKKYRRCIIKGYTGDLPEYTIKSDKNNTYIIIPVNKGKLSFKKYGFYHLIYLCHRVKDKIFYISTLESDNNSIMVFTYHVLKRYQERNQLEEISFQKFLRKNSKITTIHPEENKKDIYAYSGDGILFGEHEEGVILFKTYITERMLFEDQLEQTEELKKAREFYITLQRNEKF